MAVVRLQEKPLHSKFFVILFPDSSQVVSQVYATGPAALEEVLAPGRMRIGGKSNGRKRMVS